MNLTMEVEAVDTVWEEVVALSVAHYEEAENLPIPLRLDYGQYKLLEEYKVLVPYSVRADGVLVGYAWFIFHNATHHKGYNFASNDALYLNPDFRHGELSERVVDGIEKDLKVRGADVILYSMRPGKEYKKLLGGRGYGPVEVQWGKVVKDSN